MKLAACRTFLWLVVNANLPEKTKIETAIPAPLVHVWRRDGRVRRGGFRFDARPEDGFPVVRHAYCPAFEKTLHRWAEQKCGDSNDWASWSIERDETTGKPFRVTHPHKAGKARRESIPDRENGALRRLASITVRYPGIYGYHQTDPRGCALYLLRASDIRPGEKLDSIYSRGLPVCE